MIDLQNVDRSALNSAEKAFSEAKDAEQKAKEALIQAQDAVRSGLDKVKIAEAKYGEARTDKAWNALHDARIVVERAKDDVALSEKDHAAALEAYSIAESTCIEAARIYREACEAETTRQLNERVKEAKAAIAPFLEFVLSLRNDALNGRIELLVAQVWRELASESNELGIWVRGFPSDEARSRAILSLCASNSPPEAFGRHHLEGWEVDSAIKGTLEADLRDLAQANDRALAKHRDALENAEKLREDRIQKEREYEELSRSVPKGERVLGSSHPNIVQARNRLNALHAELFQKKAG